MQEDSSTPVLAGVRDPGRVSVLERVQAATGTADPALDRVARLAAGLLAAPAAYVTLVGADEQRSPGAVERDTEGEPTRRLPLADSICQFQVATEAALVIEDARRDPITEHNRTVLDGTVAAYAGMPLRDAQGHVLGSLCVVDRTPRAWDEDQLRLLDDLAAVVSNDLQHRLSAQRTARLQQQATQVLQQWRPHADAVAGLVELAEQSDDPRLQASAARARGTSGRLGATAEALARTVQDDAPDPARPQLPADLRRLVERAVEGARRATGTSALSLELPATPLPVTCDPVNAERTLASLLVSAMHHTPVGRALAMRLVPGAADEAELELTASGARVPAAELARLVTRFAEAVDACCERRPGPAALRMVGGGVRATSGPVVGSSAPDGLHIRARWSLAPDRPEVIDLT